MVRRTIHVSSVGTDPLSISIDDRPFDSGPARQLGSASPVEYFLISIAACFALSCRMALARRKRPGVPFEVTVLGIKALDPPSRLEVIDMDVRFPSDLADDAESIALQAKELCTVTNTLTRAPQPRVRVRTD